MLNPRKLTPYLAGCLLTLGLVSCVPSMVQAQTVSQNKQQLNELLKQGREYINVGDLERALFSYQQAARLDGQNAKIYSGMGYIYTLQDNYSAAAKAYQQALNFDPDNPDFYYALGYSLANAGDYSNAATAYYYAIQLEPRNVKHYIGLGVVLLRQQNYQKASEVYQWVLALEPNNQEAHEIMGVALLEQNRLAEATSFLQNAMAKFPNSSELKLQLASSKLAQGDLNGGLKLLQEIEHFDRGNYKVQIKIAIILEKQKRYEEALTAYRRASYLQPRALEPNAGMGRVYLATGDYLSAVVTYKELADKLPNNPDVYYNLGLALKNRGRDGEAKAILEKARQLYQKKNDQQGIQQVEQLLKK